MGLFVTLFGLYIINRLLGEGELMITTNPAGAHVYINHDQSGKTPVRIRLRKGTYNVRITSEGYRSVEETIHISPRQMTSVIVQLESQSNGGGRGR